MIATTKNIDAIYEQGIFRPLEPVEFKDHEHVRLTVESRDAILDSERLEDEEDYRIAMERIAKNEPRIPFEEIEKKYGLLEN